MRPSNSSIPQWMLLPAEGLEAAPTKGRLDFGPREQIFYREFDGQRRQRLLVKVGVIPTRGL